MKIQEEGGLKLRNVVAKLIPTIRVGMTTREIDSLAKRLIIAEGGESSFDKVPSYQWSTCLSINEQIVHTPPSGRKLEDGDILTVDIGIFYKGYHVDYADTLIIGKKKDPKSERFLTVGKNTLVKAITKFRVGNRLGDISHTIQEEIEGAGFFVIKELTGHGVGKNLHEEPFIPGFLDRSREKTMEIKQGLVCAIEIIYAYGTDKMVYEEDGWSIRTKDRSISACFEHTVALFSDKGVVLT